MNEMDLGSQRPLNQRIQTKREQQSAHNLNLIVTKMKDEWTKRPWIPKSKI